MEVARSSEMLVSYHNTTWYHNLEDLNLNRQCNYLRGKWNLITENVNSSNQNIVIIVKTSDNNLRISDISTVTQEKTFIKYWKHEVQTNWLTEWTYDQK